MSDFGGGIFLTEDWDIEANESGDVRTVTGFDELAKDVAFRTAVRFNDEIGLPLTNEALLRIKVIAKDEVLRDDRIQDIITIDVSIVDDAANRVEVVSTIEADNSEQELVFEVTP